MLPIKHERPGPCYSDGGNLLEYDLDSSNVHDFAETIEKADEMHYTINCMNNRVRKFVIVHRDRKYSGKHQIIIVLNESKFEIYYDFKETWGRNENPIHEHYEGEPHLINKLFEAIEDRLGKPIEEITHGREHHVNES